MSPWTGLLESLHSSLIDELVERHPKPKPELGMPIRKPRWAQPIDTLASTWMCQVEIQDATGVALFALESGCQKKLGISTPELWKAVLKRAGSEFERRGIEPRLDPLFELPFSAPFPSQMKEPGRWVWIPLRLNGDACYLGIGA